VPFDEASRFARVWAALTEPSRHLEDFGERRRAQFLAGLLAILLPLSFVGFGQRMVDDAFTVLDAIVSAAGLGMVSLAYFLSRTRWFRLAAWICVGSTAAASYGVLLTSEIGAVQIAFMGAAVMLAGILLPVRDTAILALLEVVAVALIPVVAPQRVIDQQAALSFVVFFGLMVVLGVRHRDRLERDRKAQLERSEERHRSHLHAAFEGLAVLKDGHLCDVNEGLGDILGTPPAGLEGTSLFSHLDEESHEPVRRALAGDTASPFEVVGRTADGTAVLLEFTSRRSSLPFDDVQFLAVRDVTQRREMERKLAITESVAALGTLAAGIGHEINNPLQYVMGNLGILQRELEPILKTLSAEKRQEIESSLLDATDGARRVGAIVKDLRTLSAPAPVHVSAASELPEAIEMVRRVANNKLRRAGVQLRVDLEDLPPVRASEAQLGQILLNLIINACHALEDAEERTIEISGHKESDDVVVMEVRDHGPGIAAADLKRVFDPFFSTKSPGRGTGLGLAIVHSIVTGLGGDIELRSELGRGTTARVHLPVAPVGSAGVPSVLEPPARKVQASRETA
jgi:PAS domain S-box-containing protein